MNNQTFEFSETVIQKLFGHEAAEDEDIQRLQEYYFKSNDYKRVMADLPLRILVGHKGTGKSALFTVARAEDRELDRLSILIQPNDVLDLEIDTSDFLHTIREWTIGIKKIIVEKSLWALGVKDLNVSEHLNSHRGNIVTYLQDILSKENYHSDKEDAILQFFDQPKIIVYIDDLDRGWQGRKKDITRISALLNAVRDIGNGDRDILFKVALRSDVYYLVRTSDESTDKLEGSVVWLSWTNNEIFLLLIKRIETFFGRNPDIEELQELSQRSLADRFLVSIMEPKFTGKGLWENAPMYRVLMSLIRKRPRDLVKLCTLAARHAYSRKSKVIETEDFKAVFDEYSQGRIQDTINEFRSELPAIEKLVLNMKPNKKERTAKAGFVYTTPDLLNKLNNISEHNRFTWANNTPCDNKDLGAFLYKINFLTARKEKSDGIVRKYFEENRYLHSSFVDFGFDWEVHPAYRWALQPDSIEDIYDSLQLSDDD